MILEEIKSAVDNNKEVRWSNDLYVVKLDKILNEYNIICTANDNMIGLTHKDGITMNGKESEFYVK